MVNKNSKIFVTGHLGMVGSTCCSMLKEKGYTNIIVVPKKQLNLKDQKATFDFLKNEKPDVIINAAGKVGGIQANINNPTAFLYDNLAIQMNLIEGARLAAVENMINISSSCIYPRNCSQPMKEDYFLDGKPEPTNEGYAIAKQAGLKLVSYYKNEFKFNWLTLVPCNLYGDNDSFDPKNSHVLSALIKKFCDAYKAGDENLQMWGTGSAKREFLHTTDLAYAVVHFMEHPIEEDFINIGSGTDLSIKELATKIAKEVGFKGTLEWDSSKPDGMPRKCLDVTKMNIYGIHPVINLNEGIQRMIDNYRNEQ